MTGVGGLPLELSHGTGATRLSLESMPPPPDPRNVHVGAALVSLASLGFKTRSQIHCVVCGRKTTWACNRCPCSQERCTAVHPPTDARGTKRDCWAKHRANPTAPRATSSPTKKARAKK